MASDNKSAEALREEVLAEARREAGQTLDRARQEAAKLLAAAEAEAKRIGEEQHDRALTEARRRKELILATCPIEEGRLRVARVESLLDSVYEEARSRLVARDGFDYREAVTILAAHGVSRMTGSAFVLKVPERDRVVLGNGLGGEVALRVGRAPLDVALSYDGEIADGGVVVEDGEARQRWDNRLLARLQRMWPDLRLQVALQTSLVQNAAKGESGS